MKIINYLEYLQEGYFFSDKTISIDLKLFENNKINKLLIVGFSGGGKTTFGKYLSKKYSVKLYQTDDCGDEYWDDSKFWKNYFSCIKKLLKSKDRCIIEGIGILDIYKDNSINLNNLILSYPTIILGTSTLISSLRAISRSKKNIKNLINKMRHVYSLNVKQLPKILNKFRYDKINIPNSDVQELKIPKEVNR